MPRQTRYRGELARPINFEGGPPVDEAGRESLEEIEARETNRRMHLLFKHYGLRYGDWEDLAHIIAFNHVPGFALNYPQSKSKGGRPAHLTVEQSDLLVETINRILVDARASGNKARSTINGACIYLIKESVAPRLLNPPSIRIDEWIGILKRAYGKSPNKLS